MPAPQAAQPTLKASLDRGSVHPGDTVRLVETVPGNAPVKLSTVTHTVTRIGTYDSNLGRVVQDKVVDWIPLVNSSDAFEDLQDGLTSPHGLSFDIRTPREKGIEIEFRPKRLGMYLITPVWSIKESKEDLIGEPVLLIVRPPLDSQDRPIVKPDWIKRINE